MLYNFTSYFNYNFIFFLDFDFSVSIWFVYVGNFVRFAQMFIISKIQSSVNLYRAKLLYKEIFYPSGT